MKRRRNIILRGLLACLAGAFCVSCGEKGPAQIEDGVGDPGPSAEADDVDRAEEGCAERGLGDVWLESDGCTTCVCLPGGVDCSEEACEPLSCEELVSTYAERVEGARSCVQDADCRVLIGQCPMGLGGCHEAVNGTLFQQDLSELGEESLGARCPADECQCGATPPVGCQDGSCALLKFCGEYELGESWSSDDGCNTCLCAVEGPVCTQNDCADPCEGAELPECPRSCDPELLDGEACNLASDCGDEEGRLCECRQGVWRCGQLEPPVEGCGLFCSPRQVVSCEEIEERYDTLLANNNTCELDADCQILSGQCGLGLGGCHEAVNGDLEQQDLSLLGAAFFQEGCTEMVCQCDPAPPAVCSSGVCVAENPCGDRAFGEVWATDNGCNTCACTLEGVVCTSDPCPVCEELDIEHSGLIEGAKFCEREEECQILEGHCGVGDCYEYVNMSLTQSELDELNGRFREGQCVDLMLCHCMLPFDVDCVQSRCKAIFE